VRRPSCSWVCVLRSWPTVLDSRKGCEKPTLLNVQRGDGALLLTVAMPGRTVFGVNGKPPKGKEFGMGAQATDAQGNVVAWFRTAQSSYPDCGQSTSYRLFCNRPAMANQQPTQIDAGTQGYLWATALRPANWGRELGPDPGIIRIVDAARCAPSSDAPLDFPPLGLTASARQQPDLHH
jgi:hypothetical protein